MSGFVKDLRLQVKNRNRKAFLVLLVEGKGSPDQNYLLDLKQEVPSSLSPFLRLPQPQWANQAERVVSIRQWTQVMPPALLTAVELDGAGYVLRELQPREDKVQVESLAAKLERWEEVVTVIAKVLAWDQLHGGGHHGSQLPLGRRTNTRRPHPFPHHSRPYGFHDSFPSALHFSENLIPLGNSRQRRNHRLG